MKCIRKHKRQNRSVRVGKYTVIQNGDNYHIAVFYGDEFVGHSSCTGWLSKKELRNEAKRYEDFHKLIEEQTSI